MNAIKLYVSTARLVLENDHFDYALCKAISSSFASLELSLTCTVCRGLLAEPHSPADSSCQHHVCQRCLGGHKKLKPSCSWCKDWSKYARNTQLQCLLSCYRGLCHYVKCSNLLTDPNSLPEPEKRVVLGVLNRGTQLDGNAASGREPKLTVSSPYSMTSLRPDGNLRHYRQFPVTSTAGHRHNDSSAANSSDESGSPADVAPVKAERRRSPEYQIAPKPTRSDQSKAETHTLRLRRVNSSEESATSDAESQPLYSVAFASTRSKLILKRRNVPKPKREIRHPKPDDSGQQLPNVAYTLQPSEYLQVMSNGLYNFKIVIANNLFVSYLFFRVVITWIWKETAEADSENLNTTNRFLPVDVALLLHSRGSLLAVARDALVICRRRLAPVADVVVVAILI